MIEAKPIVDKKYWILKQDDRKVGVVEAVDIIESQRPHVLAGNAVVVLHGRIDRGIGGRIGRLAVGNQSL